MMGPQGPPSGPPVPPGPGTDMPTNTQQPLPMSGFSQAQPMPQGGYRGPVMPGQGPNMNRKRNGNNLSSNRANKLYICLSKQDQRPDQVPNSTEVDRKDIPSNRVSKDTLVHTQIRILGQIIKGLRQLGTLLANRTSTRLQIPRSNRDIRLLISLATVLQILEIVTDRSQGAIRLLLTSLQLDTALRLLASKDILRLIHRSRVSPPVVNRSSLVNMAARVLSPLINRLLSLLKTRTTQLRVVIIHLRLPKGIQTTLRLRIIHLRQLRALLNLLLDRSRTPGLRVATGINRVRVLVLGLVLALLNTVQLPRLRLSALHQLAE